MLCISYIAVFPSRTERTGVYNSIYMHPGKYGATAVFLTRT